MAHMAHMAHHLVKEFGRVTAAPTRTKAADRPTVPVGRDGRDRQSALNRHTRFGALVDYLAFDGRQRATMTIVRARRTAVRARIATVRPSGSLWRWWWRERICKAERAFRGVVLVSLVMDPGASTRARL
jgi:hypothetical protein